MIEYFHLYIKVDCPFCQEAVTLLETKKKDFVVTVMDKCEPFAQSVKREFNFPTVPAVLQCGAEGKVKMIGGYAELKALLGEGTS